MHHFTQVCKIAIYDVLIRYRRLEMSSLSLIFLAQIIQLYSSSLKTCTVVSSFTFIQLLNICQISDSSSTPIISQSVIVNIMHISLHLLEIYIKSSQVKSKYVYFRRHIIYAQTLEHGAKQNQCMGIQHQVWYTSCYSSWNTLVFQLMYDTWRPGPNGRSFADDIFKKKSSMKKSLSMILDFTEICFQSTFNILPALV